ncbi:MAG: TRAP transporter large permease subunit [Alphaproteobacteria bacterium]|nr:TRAP transporter large permease subunit [Alphaproteobacteria bacterium SS10]
MGERELIGVVALLALFLMIAIRMPVALAMLLIAIIGTWVLSLVAPVVKFVPYLLQFKTGLWGLVANYDLSIIPLFILMGYLAGEAGLSRDLFHGLNVLTARLRGGAAYATIAACAGFGAVSGSSVATAGTMSQVALPELKRLSYDQGLATGVLAAGGTLGILIPPSVALVVYAIVVEASIISMFRAALLPGLMAVLFFMGVVWWQLRRQSAPAAGQALPTGEEYRAAFRRLLPVSLIFGGLILGLGLGLFTPTPAAAIGVFVVLAFGLWRGMGQSTGIAWPGLRRALLATAKTTAMIFFILFAADVLKGFFARTGLPLALSSWAANAGIDPYLLLFSMLLLLILLGCFLESLSMILVVVPFLWPVLVSLNGGDFVSADQAGFGMTTDELKIWFGILALVVVELGLITPPVGLNVFVIKAQAPQIPIGTIFTGVLPFVLVEVLRVGLLLLMPGLVLLVPRLLG